MFQRKAPTKTRTFKKRKLPCACCGKGTYLPRRYVPYHIGYCCRECASVESGPGWQCKKHYGMPTPQVNWRDFQSNSCQAIARREKAKYGNQR